MNHENSENVSDEMLMARADGELSDQDAERLDARIARDPELLARYSLFIDTRDALRAAVSPGPIPEELIEATNSPSEERVEAGLFSKSALNWPVSMAASLVLGIGLGWGVTNGKNGPDTVGLPEIARSVGSIATGQTYELPDGSRARVLGTFATMNGVCRLVSHSQEQTLETRFVTCREKETWQIALSVAVTSGEAFTPASDAATELVDVFLDSIESGPALLPEEERSALLKPALK